MSLEIRSNVFLLELVFFKRNQLINLSTYISTSIYKKMEKNVLMPRNNTCSAHHIYFMMFSQKI